jgi:T5SS/PEP-CTERM-associated repeat protein
MLLGLGAVCLLAYVWRRRAASLFRGCNATSLCLVTTLVTVVICDESLAAEVRYFRGFGYYGPSYDDPLYDGSWFARDGRVWGLEISSPGPNDTAIFDADYVDPHPDYISLGDYWRQDSEYPVRGEVATIDSMFVQSGTYHLQFAPNVSSPPIPNPPPPQRGGLDIRNALTVSGGNLYLSGLGAIGTCCGPVSTRADKFFVGGIGTTANVSVENGAALYSNLADIGRATGQHASLAVDGPGSTWYVMGSGYLEVGHDSSPPSPVISGGRMTMDITGGAAVYSGPSVIVAAAGNVAKVTVSGSESLWDAGEILIQGPGDATLEVRSQGTVLSSSVSINGSAVVRDPGSVWKVGTEYTQGDMHVLGKLTVESQGSLIASSLDVSGTVKIGGSRPNFDPGTVTVGGTTTVAAPAGGSARIALTRAGSKLIMRDLDLGNQVGDQAGSLQIFQGSHVDATNVSVHPNSLLAMDIRKGSLLELAPEGTFTNDGVVYLSVSAISSFGSPLPAGGKYFPILSENWAGTGSYVTVGGHWDNLEHAFIMSEEGHGTKGSPITVDLQTTQRVVIENLETGRSVGLSFGAASSSLSLTANIISDSDLYDLQDSIAPGQSIQAAWDFAIASGYQQGDPVYLSFDIGDGFSPDDLRIWHFDGDLWTSYKPNDLTYDGQNVSFTAYGFSGYAIAAVPEPQTLTLFGMALVGYAGYRLRRQRTTRPS